MSTTILTSSQKNKITLAQAYLKAAAALLEVLDTELQMDGTTGPNPINHVADDLLMTRSYIGSWKKEGIEL